MSNPNPRVRHSGALFILIGLIGSQLIGSLAMPNVLAGANTPPTIVASSSTPLLQTPNISAVISDPSDPAATIGIVLTVSDGETAVAALVVTATSSNSAVVPNANLVLSGAGAIRTLKITPVGVGYATITVTVTDAANQTGSAFLNYAASAASVAPGVSRFHTGTSDASTAIAVDADYMFVATDENEKLGLYNRKNSGLPLALFDVQGSLQLTDTSNGVLREADIEAAARSGNRIFWLASHSNAANGNQRPNRRRLFATDISGTGASATLSYVGRYDGLRTDMITWDTSNAHGKGANFYGLAASTTTGVIPESADGSGFNIEGIEFAPDGTTLYVAFRAPIAPAAARTKALIIPVTNAAALVSANPSAGPAIFGAPIELDLGGRGIREIRKNSANEYVISAGPAADATGVAPADFRLYAWTGLPSDAPVLRTASLTALTTGGSFETIVEVPLPLLSTSQLQLLTDNGDTIWYNDGVASKLLPQLPFQKFRSDIVTLGPDVNAIRIRDIQGASHTSPLVTVVTNDSISTGLGVTNVPGIVTAVTNSGFYLQDPAPDADIATSEGIFVFASLPRPAVGDSVTVSGVAIEFRSTIVSNLTITAITGAGANPLSWVLASAGNPLPVATVIGAGGRVPPTSVIEDDSASNIETSNSFDPASDGIDFYESLEGMRVQVNNALVVGPTTSNGEIAVLADNGTGAGPRTTRGGIIIGEGYTDFNPERVILDDALTAMPQATVGDSLGNVIGVFSYTFGNYKLLATQAPTLTPANLARETTALTGATNGLTIADFNVENLRPSDTARMAQIAQIIVQNLGAPDILTVQEIQDNNGATNDTAVTADLTFQALINAITTAGGPIYQFRTVDPVDDQDGGELGGNIRQGFLFRTDRGLAFVDRTAPAGTNVSTAAVSVVAGPQLSWSPGRIDPTNAAFNSSRKPLVGEFSYNGRTLFVINNHMNSKSGDQPLFGRFQPPVRSSETQRLQQAQVLAGFVGQLLAADPNTAIVVAGDLNDFHFSQVLTTLTSAGMVDLISTLPATERYTYIFDGNSQSLDHIIVSAGLASAAEYDIVHVNSEYPDSIRVSDHEPSVARLTLGEAQRMIYLPLVMK